MHGSDRERWGREFAAGGCVGQDLDLLRRSETRQKAPLEIRCTLAIRQ